MITITTKLAVKKAKTVSARAAARNMETIEKILLYLAKTFGEPKGNPFAPVFKDKIAKKTYKDLYRQYEENYQIVLPILLENDERVEREKTAEWLKTQKAA